MQLTFPGLRGSHKLEREFTTCEVASVLGGIGDLGECGVGASGLSAVGCEGRRVLSRTVLQCVCGGMSFVNCDLNDHDIGLGKPCEELQQVVSAKTVLQAFPIKCQMIVLVFQDMVSMAYNPVPQDCLQDPAPPLPRHQHFQMLKPPYIKWCSICI